jgi:hypothetical protein
MFDFSKTMLERPFHVALSRLKGGRYISFEYELLYCKVLQGLRKRNCFKKKYLFCDVKTKSLLDT